MWRRFDLSRGRWQERTAVAVAVAVAVADAAAAGDMILLTLEAIPGLVEVCWRQVIRPRALGKREVGVGVAFRSPVACRETQGALVKQFALRQITQAV